MWIIVFVTDFERYKVTSRGKQVENKLLKNTSCTTCQKMFSVGGWIFPGKWPTTCETLDLLSTWKGPCSQSINDWYLGTFEFGHSQSTLDPNVSGDLSVRFEFPNISSKDLRINSWPMLMHCCLVLNRCWLDIWIGGKYMWGQVPPTFVLTALDQIPQTLWQIWCLFFCPGLHLLRFLDTDTARKKNNTTDYQKTWRVCVCVCDDSVIFSSMFCEKQKGCSEKKHVALSYDANPDGYEKSWCAAKAWTHRFPFVPAGNECKQLWIPL